MVADEKEMISQNTCDVIMDVATDDSFFSLLNYHKPSRYESCVSVPPTCKEKHVNHFHRHYNFITSEI